MEKLRAAVIGLGNIGFMMGLDRLRKDTWSHVDAYIRSEKTELVGAVETDPRRARLFAKHHKNIPVFKSLEALMDNASCQIVSICTPTQTHLDIVRRVAKKAVGAILCEKPIALSLKDGREIIDLCRKRGVTLAVHHNRRWDDAHIASSKMIKDGLIGNIRAVSTLYSSKVLNIGTHLFDTVRMLTSRDGRCVSAFETGAAHSDPSLSGVVILDGGVPCTVLSTGKREDLIFEFDIIGDQGRMRITENGSNVSLSLFKESKRYSGYRELHKAPIRIRKRNDPFIHVIDNMCDVVNGRKKRVNCSGEDAFKALDLCLAMCKSSRRGGSPVKVGSR